MSLSVPQTRKENRIRRTFGSRAFDVFNVIFMLLFLLVTLYPFWYVVIVSLSDGKAVLSGQVSLWPVNITLDTYRVVLRDSSIITGFKNTVIYTSLGTFINLVCTSLCAYPLSRPDLLGKKQVMGMIVFTMFFSGGMIPAYLVMNQTKLIDTIWAMVLPGAISTYTLFYDNRVKRNLKPISLSSTEDRVTQVEIHSTINAMVAITDAVTETMLLYLDDQYVFSDGLYSFEDCFNTLYSFADYDADYWRSLLGQRIMLEMLPATQMTQKRVNTTQTVIPAVYTTSVSGRPVVAVIALSVDSMVATVRNNLFSQGVQLVILDKEDRLMYGDFDTGLIHPDGAGGYERIRLADAPYHVISTSSQQSGLQYYLAVPDSVIYAMSDDYLLFIVAALVMCLVAGGCGAPRRHCGQAQAAERILSRADGHAGHRQRIQPYGQHSGLCGKALLQRPVPGTDCPGAGPVGEIYFQGVQGKDRTKPVGLY